MSTKIDRFVEVELRVTRQQPAAADLTSLLQDWGLNNSTQEQLWVIAYDAAEQVRTVAEVARGTYHEVSVHIPAVLAVVLIAGVDRFQIAHNHPTGDPNPTVLDLELTRTLMEAANAAGLSFDDHIIVAPNGRSYSFAANGLLVPNPALLEASRTGHRLIRSA